MPSTTEIFTFLFLMLGPFKIIGPFAKMTENATPQLTQQLATRAILFSILGILIASVLGENVLANFGIPIPILALTGGLILFLVALSNVIQQYAPPAPKEAQPEPTLNMALSPLAFPTIITPYGIAAVIVFMTISPDLNAKLLIGAIVIGIMLLNLAVMLLTKRIGKILFLFLSIIGSVLAVIQVALGLMIIYNQFKLLFNIS